MLFIFDMGGVVTSTFQMDSIYKKLNISKETFLEICSLQNNNIWKDLEIGKISTENFWTEFNKRVLCAQRNQDDNILQFGAPSTPSAPSMSVFKNYQNIPFVQHDLFRLFFHPQLNEKTVELIKALRKKHRVVCGTNTIQSHWENHMERGDYSYFDQTYASNKIGAAKPDKKFFELILEAEGYEAKDAFFTDDKQENCDAAKSLRINTKLCTSPEDLFNDWIKYTD